MIESEEKRKELTNIITRWCSLTKTKHLLRNHDVPMLVNQILEEFYHIHLCCGHMVQDFNDGVHIAFKDMINGEEGEVSGLYCWDCAEEYKRDLGAWEVK